MRAFYMFLFFPVLRRGSFVSGVGSICNVSILPRLATGIIAGGIAGTVATVSILARLATGISYAVKEECIKQFLFFPVLRRGSAIITNILL